MLSLPFFGVKAQQHFVIGVACQFLNMYKKTVLKIWLNPGLNVTTFRGTRQSIWIKRAFSIIIIIIIIIIMIIIIIIIIIIVIVFL